MEHIALLAITTGSEELALHRVRLGKNIIHTNQSCTSIDRQGHNDWYISFESRNSCNKITINFKWNKNDGIGVNPSKTIGSIIPKITNMKSVTGIRSGSNSGDGIPPRNTGSLGIFDRGYSDLSYRSALWYDS